MNKDINTNFDFIFLVCTIIKNKWLLTKTTLIGLLLGMLIALTMNKEYVSEAMIVPEVSTNTTGALSMLTSAISNRIGLDNNPDAISPDLYPQLLETRPFVLKLFKVPVSTADGKIKTTYSDYKLQHYNRSSITNLFGLLKSDKKNNVCKNLDQFRLTKDQDKLVKSISQDIRCTVDKETNVITITVHSQDALIAATIADTVVVNIQKFIVDYRTAKARNDLKYMQKLFAEAKAQYISSQQRYAAYADANQDLVLESYKAKENDLENEMQLRYNIYSQVAQQLQMAKAKVQEKTPVYAVLQPASVPIRAAGLGKMFVVLAFTFVGFVFGLFWLLFIKELFFNIRHQFIFNPVDKK
jgi:uncharacterized protein involved in exopolysaccharide biosynthesis